MLQAPSFLESAKRYNKFFSENNVEMQAPFVVFYRKQNGNEPACNNLEDIMFKLGFPH